MARVAINGFGRIGRGFLRAVYSKMGSTHSTSSGQAGSPQGGIEVVAVNDLTSADNLAYLLKYDSVYGKAPFEVSSEGNAIVAGGKHIPVLAERDPSKLPWRDMNVDIIVESTGFFTDPVKARAHIDAGAKRVVITAPLKGDPSTWLGAGGAETILIGANEERFGTCDISSNASCTTNAASPLIGILDEAIGIEKALLSTAHGYTASQSLVDAPNAKDWKEGRAAAINIVPTSSGAAIATTLAYPKLSGQFDGFAFRVPVPAGSLVDVTFISKRPTSVEEVNSALKAAAQNDRWKRVFAISEEPLVSSDIVGEPYGAIADLALTRVVGGNLVKVLAWYDNEAGYSHTLVEHVLAVAKHI